MATTTIDISKHPTQLADLLALVGAGTDVIITQDNKTVARMMPMNDATERIGNLNPDSIQTSDDFDASLPDAFWLGRKLNSESEGFQAWILKAVVRS